MPGLDKQNAEVPPCHTSHPMPQERPPGREIALVSAVGWRRQGRSDTAHPKTARMVKGRAMVSRVDVKCPGKPG